MAEPTDGNASGPGRPNGSIDGRFPDPFDRSSDDHSVIDPSAVAAAASGGGSRDSGAAPKRRGKPPGRANATTEARVSARTALDFSALQGLLIGAHALAAVKIGPEWDMQPTEAKALSDAVARVARHYNIETTQKAIDIAGLMGAIATSYGSRIGATVLRQQIAKPAARPAPASTAPLRSGPAMGPISPGPISAVDPIGTPILN